MSLVLRAPTPQDVEAIVPLWMASYGRPRDDLVPRATRFFTEEREDLHLIAELDGRAVGWARAAWLDATAEGPANCVPPGWYLLGLNVDDRFGRRGIGRALTRARLAWLAERTDEVLYFADWDNEASLALHAEFGFEQAADDVWFPGIPEGSPRVVLLRAILGGPGGVGG